MADQLYYKTASTSYRRQAEKPFVSESDPSSFGHGNLTAMGYGNSTKSKKETTCYCCPKKIKDADTEIVKSCNKEMRSPITGCKMTYSPTREKVSVGVGVVPVKSIQTQTSKSLMFSDYDSATTDSKEGESIVTRGHFVKQKSFRLYSTTTIITCCRSQT